MSSVTGSSEVSSGGQMIEISHGSDYSKFSSRSNTPETPLYRVAPLAYIIVIILCVVAVTWVPLLWYGNVGHASRALKKYKRYRVPVVISVSFVGGVIICAMLLFLCRSRQCRYVERTSKYHNESIAKSDYMPVPSGEDSFVSHSSSHNVSFRQRLEELSIDVVKEIREVVSLSCGGEDWLIVQPSANDTHVVGGGKRSGSLSHYRPEYVIYMQGESYQEDDSAVRGHIHHSFINYSVVCHNVRLKALLIGESNVGKTSIFHRILYDQFSNTYITTLGCDVGVNNVLFSNKEGDKDVECSVHLWDIGGTGLKYDLCNVVFKDTVLFLAVCDASSPNLRGLMDWLRAIKDRILNPNVAIFINKTDLHFTSITKERITSDPNFSGIQVFEVSAKTGEGVTDSFRIAIARAMWSETSKVADMYEDQ